MKNACVMCKDTYNVRNLAERMLLEMFRFFMFTLHYIDCNELIWDPFLLEHDSYPASAGGERCAIDFQDHPSNEVAVGM